MPPVQNNFDHTYTKLHTNNREEVLFGPIMQIYFSSINHENLNDYYHFLISKSVTLYIETPIISDNRCWE